MASERVDSLAAYSALAARHWQASGSHPKFCQEQDFAYTRNDNSEFSQYTALAAARWRSRSLNDCYRNFILQFREALGRGPSPRGGVFDIGREKWELSSSDSRSLCSQKNDSLVVEVFVHNCGIPSDVIEIVRAHAGNMTKKSVHVPISALQHSSWPSRDALGFSCGECVAAREQYKNDFLSHCRRARRFFAAGRASLPSCVSENSHVLSQPNSVNDFAAAGEDSGIYVGSPSISDRGEMASSACFGKPDEIYRRRAARKYATWKAEKRRNDVENRRIVHAAELEMKRRRGHDLMLSDRKVGDQDFAPFLFDNANTCFAFSSRIPDKQNLREMMINRYTCPEVADSRKLNDATYIAATTELFHTKVMNRFT